MLLPQDFELSTRTLMGDELYTAFTAALSQEPPVSIRINPLKVDTTSGDDYKRVPWCGEGRYLSARPAFTFDPLLHAGCYYVQEASSMMVAHVVRTLIDKPVVALDLCAAPGGKSTAVRTVLPEGSLLMSNEPIKLRAQILGENIQKFGHPDCLVTCNYPRDYRQSGLMFDLVVADVPCSGEGMFRKDADAVAEWSPEKVEQCWQLQRSIVEDVWPCLREGGLMVYSTCTYNTKEDEENVAWIASELGADVVRMDIPEEWHVGKELTGSLPAMRFIPGKSQGEGLFMAVLRKHGDSPTVWEQLGKETAKSNKKTRKQKPAAKQKAAPAIPTEAWLKGNYVLRAWRETWRAIPSAWLSLYDRVAETLHPIHAGIAMGTEKGRDLIPDASLALSAVLSEDAFPRVEVDYTTAINYLRKEAIALPNDTPRGFVVICYKGHALGFAKNIGNRANNLYPAEWKIKSSHLPDEPVNVIAAP